MAATAPAAPAPTVRSSLTVILAEEVATAGAPTTGLAGDPGAEATAAAEATRTATPPALHVAASTLAKKLKNYDARSPPRKATTMASPPSQHGFAVKPRIFIENPNPCTIAIVPGSVAIEYRTSHR
jgi:hypothetical protein